MSDDTLREDVRALLTACWRANNRAIYDSMTAFYAGIVRADMQSVDDELVETMRRLAHEVGWRSPDGVSDYRQPSTEGER